MKYVLPALVAVVCALAACETTADRRDLFAPTKPQGPYTEELRAMNSGRGSAPSTYAVAGVPPAPPMETGPIAPPPPPPPPQGMPPDMSVGAPAATPMPQTTVPGATAPATVIPGTSAPVTTTAAPSQPLAVPPPAATPAPAGAGAAPVIPGLSQ